MPPVRRTVSQGHATRVWDQPRVNGFAESQLCGHGNLLRRDACPVAYPIAMWTWRNAAWANPHGTGTSRTHLRGSLPAPASFTPAQTQVPVRGRFPLLPIDIGSGIVCYFLCLCESRSPPLADPVFQSHGGTGRSPGTLNAQPGGCPVIAW